METLVKDLTHAIRMFRQNAAFTIAAVAALALGIAANTAIFSVVNAVLLKPVPFPEPDRLVMFMNTSPQGQGAAASPAKFQHWRSQSEVVEHAAAFRTGIVNLTDSGVPEQLRSGQVSVDYFRLFGAPIVQGRPFSPEEDAPGGPRVAVISEGLWTRRFGGDPAIVGRSISLSGDPHVVIGIVSLDLRHVRVRTAPDVWTAFQLDPNTSRPGTLLPGGRPPEAGRRARPGPGAVEALGR